MAGRRPKDFRGGDLSEELGLLLLKGVAAVATVPRSEDVGIDAVATLLRLTEDNFLIAEDSFYVQFKSASQRKVKFEEHEVRWLESLKLPYFIGSISKAHSAIDLYATHHLSQAMLERKYKQISLLLDDGTETHDAEKRSIHIGPPLLRWTTHDLAEPTFAALAYSVLKPYLVIEQRNIEYRSIRYLEMISWQTGKILSSQQGSIMHHSISSEDILNVFRQMAPHLQAIVLKSSMEQDRRGLEIAIRMADYMRENGFDTNEYGQYEATYAYMSQAANRIDSSDNK